MKKIFVTKTFTTKEYVSLDKYFQDIQKENLISDEEVIKLAKLIKEGDKNALNKLVTANLRFVITVAKQYQNQGLSLPDLISEGNIGLIKAAQKYDETKGFKFISYAVWWIRQSIVYAITENCRNVRIPVNKIDLKNKINKTIELFKQQFEREPTNEELAEITEIDIDSIIDMNTMCIEELNIEAQRRDTEEGTSILETTESGLYSDDLTNKTSADIQMRQMISALTKKEQEIITLLYLNKDDKHISLDEVAEIVNLGKERVRQIKDIALRRLKNVYKSNRFNRLIKK